MITLKKLRYFEAVAQHKHFGRAAEACAVTQPALSMQIQELEEELGMRLLERRASGLLLTPEGEAILERARKVLIDVEGISQFAESRKALSGTLKLGVIPTVGPYLLPRLLPRLTSQFRDLKLSIRETQTERLLQELASGKIELAVVALPVDYPGLMKRELFHDPFLLATQEGAEPPSNHRQLRKYMEREQLLLLEEGHCLRDQAISHCDLAGIQYGEIYGTSNLSTLVQMVANGLGITLVPEICLEAEALAQPIRLTRFPDPEPYRRLGLVWRENSPRENHFEKIGAIISEIHGDRKQKVRG